MLAPIVETLLEDYDKCMAKRAEILKRSVGNTDAYAAMREHEALGLRLASHLLELPRKRLELLLLLAKSQQPTANSQQLP